MSTLPTPTEQRPTISRTTSHLSTISSKSLSISRTFSHRKDKLRLYVVLFPRGGATSGSYGSQVACESYHWALMIGPKSPLRSEAGTAYHIVHSNSDFVNTPYFEETDLTDNTHLCRNVMVRIALAKILDEDRVSSILRTLAPEATAGPGVVPRASFSSDGTPALSCLSWVKGAWESLSGDPKRPIKTYFGPSDWDNIESRTRKYVKRKRAQGRYQANIDPGDVTWNADEICTWNYWENRETTD